MGVTTMKGITVLVVLLSWVLPSSALEVGDRAPDFSLQGSDGATHTLADHRGKTAVVLAWFPKAYTRGCTIECKSLAENGHLLKRFKVRYFMASVDPLAKNKAFAEQQKADFPLLSDPEKNTARAYEVLHEQGFSRRHTFYIGSDGVIKAIDKNVRPASSAQDMAEKLAELGVPAAS
jgi:peroxiredoxin Q/BCP